MNIDDKIEKYIQLIEDRNLNDKFTIEEQDPIYDLEEEILAFYGLPLSSEISEKLQSEVVDKSDFARPVSYAKKILGMMAQEYLSSPAKTDRQILEDGKVNKKPFDNVLHYMGILPHSYCVYVYNELFCRNKISIDETISILNVFRQTPIINNLFGYEHFELKINFDVYRQLHALSLPYLNEFIQHSIDIVHRQKVDGILWSHLNEKENDLNMRLAIDNFYIKRIQKNNKFRLVFLEVLFEDKNYQWHAIVIGCDKPFLEILLSYSKFETHSSLIRINMEGAKIFDLNLDRFDMRQLEITGLTLELKSINSNGETLPHRNFMVYNYYETKKEEIFFKETFDFEDYLPF